MGLGIGIGISGSLGGKAGVAALTLTDNFNDNSRNTSLWNLGAFYEGVTTNSGTVNETGGTLQITPLASTAGAYGGYVTAATWDLTSTPVFVKVADIVAYSGNEVAYLSFGADSNNCYSMLLTGLTGGSTIARSRIGGANTNAASLGYSAANHAWIKIHHSAGNIVWSVAPGTASNPPIPSDWTQIATVALNVAVTITAVKIAIGAGCFGVDVTPTVATFDGFNTAT